MHYLSSSAGSGVLAIAALKMGAAMACGTDTDQLAVRAAAQNAALNGLSGRFQAVQCEGSAEGPEPLAALACGAPSQSGAFDVIIANILQVWKASYPDPWNWHALLHSRSVIGGRDHRTDCLPVEL